MGYSTSSDLLKALEIKSIKKKKMVEVANCCKKEK